MYSLSAIIPPLLGVLFGTAVVFVSARRRRMQGRAQDLETASAQLDRHAAALETILDSDLVPLSLKEAILDFGDASDDHDVAKRTADRLFDPAGQIPSAYMCRILEQLDALAVKDPAMASVYEGAMVSGTFAMLLRWADTAPLFHRFIQMVGDRRAEVGFAVTAAEGERDKVRLRLRERQLVAA